MTMPPIPAVQYTSHHLPAGAFIFRAPEKVEAQDDALKHYRTKRYRGGGWSDAGGEEWNFTPATESESRAEKLRAIREDAARLKLLQDDTFAGEQRLEQTWLGARGYFRHAGFPAQSKFWDEQTAWTHEFLAALPPKLN